ncbi:MAG: hypothetical protein AAGD07_16405 [Planctomycetota bacterium]
MLRNSELLQSKLSLLSSLGSILKPDSEGLFDFYGRKCVLPYLRLQCTIDDDLGPLQSPPAPFDPETWASIERGWTRFFRADQVIDWLADHHRSDNDLLTEAINRWLSVSLVPIDDQLIDRKQVLDRRVEAIRLHLMPNPHKSEPLIFHWTRRVRRNRGRVVHRSLRAKVDGLDVVHTPESARAGFTRYLSIGWEIGDDGRIVNTRDDNECCWGPGTLPIPFRTHNEPRRVMLGASFQSRAVDVKEDDSESNLDYLERVKDNYREFNLTPEAWVPPGIVLNASFSTDAGWTHEDAFVVSQSAAKKLTSIVESLYRVRIPNLAHRVEVQMDEGSEVQAGDSLVKAYVDLFALGYDIVEIEDEYPDGWQELRLLRNVAKHSGVITEHTCRESRSPRFKQTHEFRIRHEHALEVGDKLATAHGLKGVVSQIRPDDQLARFDIIVNPVSIIRRKAVGQLQEATEGKYSESGTTSVEGGSIRILRQPQDAAPRCRARGASKPKLRIRSEFDRAGDDENRSKKESASNRGQRYGEMEFAALMAHGADAIAAELLSIDRCCDPWIWYEHHLNLDANVKTLVRNAVNRHLATLGLHLSEGHIATIRSKDDGTIILAALRGSEPLVEPEPDWGPEDLLEDYEWFRRNPKSHIKLPYSEGLDVSMQFDSLVQQFNVRSVCVLPPWLRPSTQVTRHPLTKAYANLLSRLKLMGGKPTDADVASVRDILWQTQSALSGKTGFVRRQILGRRLNRSARAVIVPRPDLRIDQISIPRDVADELFDQPCEQDPRRIVLVNRNPTLHKRGLLALVPVINENPRERVFGLPLGVLNVLNADFDGDQASIVALESDEAIDQAHRLLRPGCPALRTDPYRNDSPAFPLVKELGEDKVQELRVAEANLPDESWRDAYSEMVNRQITKLASDHGWNCRTIAEETEKEEFQSLKSGISVADWLDMARQIMEDKILHAADKKGLVGGIMRRHFYRRRFESTEQFGNAVTALQAITEKLTQEALSVKSSGSDHATQKRESSPWQDADRYLADVADLPEQLAKWLSEFLDDSFESAKLVQDLGRSDEPSGLLAWLATPSPKRLFELAQVGTANRADVNADDPRIGWFFDLS